jgi:hypothetical protein
MSTISAGTSPSTALVNSGDTTGQLVLQTNGTTTAVTIGTNQVVTLAQPLPVASGGTGATSLTANNILLGNGTSAVQVVAPGTAGNVLTSNGTTWQSTAPAPSAGSITAVASGTLPNGCTVVLNSNGTVSAVAATAGSYVSGTYASRAVATGNARQIAATFDTLRNAVLVYYVDSNNQYLYAVVGTISGSTISWSTATLVQSSQTVSQSETNKPTTSVYDPSSNTHVCFWINNGGTGLYYSSCKITSLLTVSVIQSISTINPSGSYYEGLSSAYNATVNRIVVMYTDYQANAYVAAFCGYTDSSGYFYNGGDIGLDNANYNGVTTSVTTEPSTGKVIFFYQGTNDYLWARVAQLPSSGVTITSLSAATALTASNNANYKIATGYDVPSGNFVFAYVSGSSYVIRVASLSSYTLTFGSASGSIGYSYTSFSTQFRTMPGSNVTFFIAENSNGGGVVYAAPVTVTGTSSSTGSLQNVSPSATLTFKPIATVDPINLQFVVCAGNGSTGVAGRTFTNITSNLTSSNFAGFSSASYTNGQTATINVVGAINSARSGLTAGSKYYVLGDGTLSSAATTQPYAGLALSATSILVKG